MASISEVHRARSLAIATSNHPIVSIVASALLELCAHNEKERLSE
jgi:hypothetical protein